MRFAKKVNEPRIHGQPVVFMTYMKSFSGPFTRSKILSLALAAMASMALSHQASAIQWIYTLNSSPTNNSTYLDFLDSSDTTYSGTFNILTAGFVPANYTITSAIARFAFADDGDTGTEYAIIKLGSPLTTFIGSTEINGNHSAPPNSYHWLSSALNATFLGDLQADGLLNFEVKRTSGDFYVKRVVLEVYGDRNPPPPPPPPPSVPDGGATLVMLGAGLAGLAAFRCRRSSPRN